MAVKRGGFGTGDMEAGIRKLDVRDIIFELQPNKTPLIVVLSKMSKFRAIDTEFHWFEDDLLGNYTQLNMAAHAAAGITALIVDDSTIFQVGDIIQVVDTEETMLCTGVNDATNTITVSRSVGSVAAAQIDDNDYLYKLGQAMIEGYTVPQALITKKVKKSNYVQIFSKSVEITKTAENVATWGGNRRAFERRKVGIEFLRDIESQFLWGEKSEDTSGAHPRRTTGGVYEFIKTNASTLDMNSAAITESAFESWLKDIFAYDEEDRFLFTGTLVNSQISQFASNKQRMEPGTSIVYGVKVKKYHSANGDINIATDRHFIGPHAGNGLCLKMEELTYRYLQNSDVALELNLQNKKDKVKLDEYSAEIGLELHHDKKHGILKGVV